MDSGDLEKYWGRVTKGGGVEAKGVHPSSVVTAPWVRWKCQYGCVRYGKGYCCPPDTPGAEETRKALDSYERLILFHIIAEKRTGKGRRDLLQKLFRTLVDLEGEMFKDGFYKAFVLLSGPCDLCPECAKLVGGGCHFANRARPSMEACGIDVYQTARNNGFSIKPLREKNETQHNYCLMLVD
jgi:predicted metal-binding protein